MTYKGKRGGYNMKSFLFYHATSQASVVIITIALMLFTGYLMTRITRKFKLPNVTGYILAGILMGPYCLDMVPVKVTISVPRSALDEIDKKAKEYGFTRSGLIVRAAQEYRQASC